MILSLMLANSIYLKLTLDWGTIPKALFSAKWLKCNSVLRENGNTVKLLNHTVNIQMASIVQASESSERFLRQNKVEN